MKNKLFNLIIIFSFLILLLEVLQNKQLVFDTIQYSLNIWVTSILPSLFPFFVISDILISYHIIHYIPKFIKKTFGTLFQVREQILTIFFLSCLSGFPSNARNTRNLYDKKLITKEEATHALIFTHFSNPLFILSTVAVFFLKQEHYGVCILISHYLGNIILGILTRKRKYHQNTLDTLPEEKTQKNFSSILVQAIRSSVDTILLIAGTLTCFLILSSLIIHRLTLPTYPSVILKGILEITMGLKSLAILPIHDVYKVVLSTMFISFGGLSVHLQVLSQLVDTDIDYHPFFVARIFHAMISGGLCYLFFILFFS